jgi:protein phosphatase
MKRGSALNVDIVSLSDVGQKRSTNQDAYGSFVRPSGERLLVIADGMGGHRGGEIASQVAVAAIETAFETSSAAPGELLLDAFQAANVRVRERAHREPHLTGMGTTGVALWLGRKGRAWVAHVGDSRAYRLRDGVFEPLTADHSVVGELLRRGLLSPAEADAHPRRNELIRSIGAMEEMEIDVAEVDARPGDRFLLCSDGLCCVVDDAEIGQVLSRASTDEAAHELIEIAKARGGPDNITVQVVAVGRGSFPSATSIRAAALVSACALAALGTLLALWRL